MWELNLVGFFLDWWCFCSDRIRLGPCCWFYLILWQNFIIRLQSRFISRRPITRCFIINCLRRRFSALCGCLRRLDCIILLRCNLDVNGLRSLSRSFSILCNLTSGVLLCLEVFLQTLKLTSHNFTRFSCLKFSYIILRQLITLCRFRSRSSILLLRTHWLLLFRVILCLRLSLSGLFL